MKKVLSIILAIALMLSFSVVAFAATTNTLPAGENGTWTIGKVYKLVSAGTSPAEDFEFSDPVAVGEAPDDAVTIAPASFQAGAASENGTAGSFVVSVDVTKFTKPGVYEYTLKEDSTAATPGVTYDANSYTLKVTVFNDETEGAAPGALKVDTVSLNTVPAEGATSTKVTSIENTYSAGTLKISKTVTGKLGDKTMDFEFTITFTGGDANAEYPVNKDSADGATGNDAAVTTVKSGDTIYLKHGETFIIDNIPYGVEYTVVETAVENYTPTKTNDSGKIEAAEVTAAFTNDYDTTPDTGISLDSLPYILIALVVVAAVIVMLLKKRHNAEV
ncbi:MAG: hypothetical protein IKE00_00070 [Oscillospiraceae bacterium]|nr:hypothetical protein [Oscillospiraceae bacterium]